MIKPANNVIAVKAGTSQEISVPAVHSIAFSAQTAGGNLPSINANAVAINNAKPSPKRRRRAV